MLLMEHEDGHKTLLNNKSLTTTDTLQFLNFFLQLFEGRVFKFCSV